MDQILEPGDYPWQGSEAQVTAFEVKQRIQRELLILLDTEMDVINQQVLHEQRVAMQKIAMDEVKAEAERSDDDVA